MKFQNMLILLGQGRQSAKAKLALSDVPNYQTAKPPNLSWNTWIAPKYILRIGQNHHNNGYKTQDQ